ncbi:MAG: universal stress protein [Candidatus Bipolaricaulia bacterium]
MERIFRRVLVPIDGSNCSMEAGEFAIRLAKGYGLEILALHVIDETALSTLSRLARKGEEELRKELLREGEHYLNYLAEAAEREGIKLEKLIEEGTPHRVIVEIAEREGVDLILIGKVGSRGPRRILIGSVTERVIEAAKCPVLVMRAE